MQETDFLEGLYEAVKYNPAASTLSTLSQASTFSADFQEKKHISTWLNELDICVPHRNLIKPRQAVKRGEHETRVRGISDISQYASKRLRHCSGGHGVSQKSETRGDTRISLLWLRWKTQQLIHIFSARFGGKWRYQHGNHSATIFSYDFQPLHLPRRYKGQRQQHPVKKDCKLNIEHRNVMFFSIFGTPHGFVELNIWSTLVYFY